MTKKELINKIHDGIHPVSPIKKTDIENVLNGFIDIVNNLPADEKIEIRGFGIFKWVERPARTARNPINGEPVNVPAKSVLKFRPSK